MADAGTAGFGGYGGVFELILPGGPSATKGRLKPFYLGDLKHTGLDNIQFFTMNQLMVVEDAGDTLHTQRNALDSGYILDTREDYSHSAVQPLRFLAEGRDASATIDSALLSSAGFQNDGDNEITGIHVSAPRNSPGSRQAGRRHARLALWHWQR